MTPPQTRSFALAAADGAHRLQKRNYIPPAPILQRNTLTLQRSANNMTANSTTSTTTTTTGAVNATVESLSQYHQIALPLLKEMIQECKDITNDLNTLRERQMWRCMGWKLACLGISGVPNGNSQSYRMDVGIDGKE
mmetsp:Transcript_2282/g.8468  ORF Transcript_2282/g.8468 Transcript_2282/m.8468 type:complete len:137 (-) Transcript_2282:2726-3136(-)